MQEECRYGEKCLRLDCKFVHNVKKRNVPCVHFQGKGCLKGDRCLYLHIEKTSQKREPQISIDIAPMISAEVVLPAKRPADEEIVMNKEFPEDISAILDNLDEMDQVKNSEENAARSEKLLESVSGMDVDDKNCVIGEDAKDSQAEIGEGKEIEAVCVKEKKTDEMEEVKEIEAVVCVKEKKTDEMEEVKEIVLGGIEEVVVMEIAEDKPKDGVSGEQNEELQQVVTEISQKELREEVQREPLIIQSEEVTENVQVFVELQVEKKHEDLQEEPKKDVSESLQTGVLDDLQSDPLGPTNKECIDKPTPSPQDVPESKPQNNPHETPVERLEDQLTSPQAKNQKKIHEKIQEHIKQKLFENNQQRLKEKNPEKPQIKPQEKPQEEVISLKKSPSALEPKIVVETNKTAAKSNEIVLVPPKPTEPLIKIVPPTKLIQEKPLKPASNPKPEETVSLPAARKPPVAEKVTRILTLEEIKQKKKLEAQLKSEQKEETKVQKSSPQPKIDKSDTTSVKPDMVIVKPDMAAVKSDSSLKPENTPVKNETNIGKQETGLLRTDAISVVKSKSEEKSFPLKPVSSEANQGTADVIVLPSKRQATTPSPVLLKVVKPAQIPLVVSSEEWEVYRQPFLSLEFSNLNLSQEEVAGCKGIARLMSSAEGVSKVFYELEQKLLNFPDARVDPDFESLTLSEQIEKLYEESLKNY